jgi:hypothetical protein
MHPNDTDPLNLLIAYHRDSMADTLVLYQEFELMRAESLGHRVDPHDTATLFLAHWLRLAVFPQDR